MLEIAGGDPRLHDGLNNFKNSIERMISVLSSKETTNTMISPEKFGVAFKIFGWQINI